MSEKIPLDKIYIDDENNYRKKTNDGTIEELKASFIDTYKSSGGSKWLLQPIDVEPLPPGHEATEWGKSYMLVYGFNRTYAALAAAEEGHAWAKEIPSTITQNHGELLSRADRRLIQLTENVHRSDPNPMDTARALAEVREEYNLTHRDLAARISKSPSWVAQRLRLIDKLALECQDAMDDDEINFTQARELMRLPIKDQITVLAKMLRYDWSLSKLEKTVREMVSPKPPKEEEPASVEVAAPDKGDTEAGGAGQAETLADDDAPSGVDAPFDTGTGDNRQASGAAGGSGETKEGPPTEAAPSVVRQSAQVRKSINALDDRVLRGLASFQTERDGDRQFDIALEVFFQAGMRAAYREMLKGEGALEDSSVLYAAFTRETEPFGVFLEDADGD